MCSKAPRGIPHPQSEYAKRINRFAAASPISAIAQKNLVALTWKSGLDLVHDPLPDLNLVTIGPNGVRIYDGITGRDQYVVKGTTVLQGTVSDLLGQLQFQAASSHECRRSFYKLFLRTFSHSINFPQEGASVDANGFQVHWLALRGDGVHSTPFDMVIASYTQQYVWDHSEWRPWTPHDGSQRAQDAGTHVWESIDTRMMPPFHDATTTTGCSRLHIHRSGFVVEKCVDLANYCEVSFILRFNEHGLSRPWLYELVGGFPRYFRRDLFSDSTVAATTVGCVAMRPVPTAHTMSRSTLPRTSKPQLLGASQSSCVTSAVCTTERVGKTTVP
ncbi:hypothetical protein H310_01186 [Aphanomyces invadans]|uniref:START domain-containing protein n=1 Tax=Aphanomyces invadans TaxID=157072 RepID=A0A024USJ7_9STRA|nr:hypothetical protein H310_01186 [Aphanomyces invadans]ETW08653.1 hypothetical protein H310_01186 [Aphanomyces invadans]|eukprot:XP_008862458.1 hypothetical protein H310_01186 [Aphanomyces invadans]